MASQDGGGALPLRPALVQDDEMRSPRTGPSKTVSISNIPETFEPLPTPAMEDGQRIKQFNAGIGKRISGRPVVTSNNSSRLSMMSSSSVEDYPLAQTPQDYVPDHQKRHHNHFHTKHHEKHPHENLLTQVAEWLQAEKAKRAARKSQKRMSGENSQTSFVPENEINGNSRKQRTGSQDSSSSELSLERLQQILEDNMSTFGQDRGLRSAGTSVVSISPEIAPRRPSITARSHRKSSVKDSRKAYSSDTEYQDGDAMVPSCDVILDNTKTLGYAGGAAESDISLLSTRKRAEKERQAWIVFKNEIVRLAHTLKFKGWRRVPLDRGCDIEVERLSGALTNAVYVVVPPKDVPQTSSSSSTVTLSSKKPPPTLLLRIYGPQVEHLIDRENELNILRRLARKRIGPRLLGTFRNGRFEEYLNSTTLTNADLRNPNTSKQIAKRMRELHDGVELLERERDEGPFVWRNWDKWVDRCEQVITWVDNQILSGKLGPANSKAEAWKERGLICGVEWPVFKATIDKYRKFLDQYYGGPAGIREKLIFAHNDTQYGNILRLKPAGESPLLLPANEHKQLVVIDFEYASANVPGLEFANHFTEWCYNYHDSHAPYICQTQNYPTIEEQRRFIKSYVDHRPQFNPKASATPLSRPDQGPSHSISAFMLDSRAPPGNSGVYNYAEEEEKRLKATEKEVERLREETRIWRIANTAQWVAWGIVQAKLPELDSTPRPSPKNSPDQVDGTNHVYGTNQVYGAADEISVNGGSSDKLEKEYEEKAKEMAVEEQEEDEFDYLGYAQDRAMFFWGDVVGLGIVGREELPEGLWEKCKVVDY